LKYRPVVFAVAALLAFFRLGHLEPATVAASALLSVVDLYYIGVFWTFGLMAMACAEALKSALYWAGLLAPKRTELEAQSTPSRRKRLVFNVANPEDAERLMQLFEPIADERF